MDFLIDVNLPQKFSFFHSNEFTHVVDIDPRMKDGAIWEYAKTHKMTILTKDSDFFTSPCWMTPGLESFILNLEIQHYPNFMHIFPPIGH